MKRLRKKKLKPHLKWKAIPNKTLLTSAFNLNCLWVWTGKEEGSQIPEPVLMAVAIIRGKSVLGAKHTAFKDNFPKYIYPAKQKDIDRMYYWKDGYKPK